MFYIGVHLLLPVVEGAEGHGCWAGRAAGPVGDEADGHASVAGWRRMGCGVCEKASTWRVGAQQRRKSSRGRG